MNIKHALALVIIVVGYILILLLLYKREQKENRKDLENTERLKEEKEKELEKLVKVGEQLLTLNEFQESDTRRKIEDSIQQAKRDLKEN